MDIPLVYYPQCEGDHTRNCYLCALNQVRRRGLAGGPASDFIAASLGLVCILVALHASVGYAVRHLLQLEIARRVLSNAGQLLHFQLLGFPG